MADEKVIRGLICWHAVVVVRMVESPQGKIEYNVAESPLRFALKIVIMMIHGRHELIQF